MKWNYDYFTHKFKNMPDSIQIVCIGTTQAHFAFDFTDEKVSAFNMAVFMNYFTYSRLLLEKYQNNIKHNAVILITLQYPIFLCSEQSCRTIDTILQYSKILFGNDPSTSMAKQIIFRLLPDRCWSSEDFSSWSKLNMRNININHYKPWELERLIEDLVHNGWENCTECNHLFMKGRQIAQEDKDKMRGSIKCILDLIDLCQSHDWKPVLLSLPFSKIFNDKIPEEFKEYYYFQCIEEIVDRKGCLWLNYSCDRRMENINYYIDMWLLNERGRRRFTDIVLRDLKGHSLC